MTAKTWLRQAHSDYLSIEKLYVPGHSKLYCQVIAKAQQTIEKAIKGLIIQLPIGISLSQLTANHEIERFVSLLVLWIHDQDFSSRDVYGTISNLFSPEVKSAIKQIESLIPKKNPKRKNTEYPFQRDSIWMAPSDEGVFSYEEISRFRNIARNVFTSANKIVSALQSTP